MLRFVYGYCLELVRKVGWLVCSEEEDGRVGVRL